MYVIRSDKKYIGIDNEGTATIVKTLLKALKFTTYTKADNFRKNLRKTLKKHSWIVEKIKSVDTELPVISDEIEETNTSHTGTAFEEDNFDLKKYLINTIVLFSQLEEFANNMKNVEQEKSDIITDIHHYLRDENTKLNAIQMQKIGYFLQTVLRERWDSKQKRLIAEDVLSNIEKIKSKKYIDEVKSYYDSNYKPRVMEFSLIDSMIGRNILRGEKC